jgi:ribose/xylose/arabinose/galactoside ABC-type transport system permease subunit
MPPGDGSGAPFVRGSGLTDYYTQAIYGAVILIAVAIHAVLQKRFEH